MQRGINHLIDVVRPTLGPLTRMVAVENVFRDRTPELLDSAGVISRRIIQLPERDADIGAMLVRQLLLQLHEQVGDGAATAAVLFQTVYNRGLRYIAAGGNAMQLRRYLERGAYEIVDGLKSQTFALEGKDRLAQLAESVCFDPPLARLLGEIFDIVGEYGHVDIRAGHRRELERHYVQGMYWKSSILSPYMLADQMNLRTDLTNAAILISDLELEDPRALMPVLDMAMQAGIRALLIVATKLSEPAIALLLAASREPEKFQVIAAQTPGLGSVEQAAALEDLVVLTGGRALIQAAGDSLRGLKAADFGSARRAWSDKVHLGIVGGKGGAHRLRAHIATLRAAHALADDNTQRARLQERIGKLMGGSATLIIGGNAEGEITVREELARRAATLLRAALHGGALPGGGIALLACRARLRRLLEGSTNPDEITAYRILLHGLEEPLRTIVANAGYDAGSVLGDVDQAGEGFGFDVRRGQVVDMARSGILDVAAVQVAAVQGAISAAATALTVDILIHKRNPVSTAGHP